VERTTAFYEEKKHMGMLAAIVAAIMLIACLLFVGGCSQKTSPAPLAPRAPVVSAGEMQSLDRETVRAMLKCLADTPPPPTDAVTAMCYSVAPSPDRADYICPHCGERTVYVAANFKTENLYDRTVTETVAWTIPSCRRHLDALRQSAGRAIIFDESQFCRKCSPKVVLPKLILHICLKGEKVRDIEKFDDDDVRILADLLAGKLLTEDHYKYPLKDRLPRLQDMLGVKTGN
jgi:hypothetical protein